MKSPNTARGVRAFRVTSNATVVRASDDTRGPARATPHDARFYWDRGSNSYERLVKSMGRAWQ
jgi:hypothetical protein